MLYSPATYHSPAATTSQAPCKYSQMMALDMTLWGLVMQLPGDCMERDQVMESQLKEESLLRSRFIPDQTQHALCLGTDMLVVAGVDEAISGFCEWPDTATALASKHIFSLDRVHVCFEVFSPGECLHVSSV